MERIKLVTPPGISSYPKLGKPDTKYVSEGEFSTKLKFDSNDEKAARFLQQIEAALPEAVEWAKEEILKPALAKAEAKKDKAAIGKAKKALESVEQADSPAKVVLDEDGNETNLVEIRFKAKAEFKDKEGNTVKKTHIPCKDAKRNNVDPRKVKIGGGSVMKAAVVMYPYHNAKDNVAGVTFRLEAVQILKLVEYSGGDYGFGDEDGDAIETPADETSSATTDTESPDDF